MPKKSGRGYRKYLRGNVDELMTLGTLAGRTLVSQVMDETVNERTWISSLIASWSITEFTPGTDIGPIMVGVAHGDYSAAEIEEFIENTQSWNEGDLIAQEVAKRKIRVIGIFRGPDLATGNMLLNEGKSVRTKLGFVLNQGETLDTWAFNLGTVAIGTIDPQIMIQGHVNLWPGK